MTFASPGDMASTFQAFAQCAPWQELMAFSGQNSTPHSQYVVRPVVVGGDTTKDGAYTVWQMRVEDEATYAKAFEELMQEQVKNSDVAGAYGLWRVVGGSDQEVTHISFAGAPNIAELLSGSMQPTKAVQKFYSEVGELRSVTRQVMNTVVGDFQSKKRGRLGLGPQRLQQFSIIDLYTRAYDADAWRGVAVVAGTDIDIGGWCFELYTETQTPAIVSMTEFILLCEADASCFLHARRW